MNSYGSHISVTLVLTQTMQYMIGAKTLDEAAHSAGVSPGLITQLSSEYASYMLPRAARALRSEE